MASLSGNDATVFNPGDPACWIGRGRLPAHAALIAAAWRDYPDLAATAPLEARMARTRARVQAMRPVHDAIRIETERSRQAGNFAYTEGRLARGQGDDRDIAILRGRDSHGYDWDQAVRYAEGWITSHAGWEPRPPSATVALRAAYDRGFEDGGGDSVDLFDTARRAMRAAERTSNLPAVAAPVVTARPLPGTWPRPTDAPRPTPWSRRILLIEGPDIEPAGDGAPALALFRGPAFDRIRAHAGATGATIVILSPAHGFVLATETILPIAGTMTADRAAQLGHDQAQRERLRRLLHARDHDDMLVVANGDYLAVIDAHASALPLCRTMERCRNTPLQQKAHLRIWLDRGLAPGATMGAGHIRWSKLAQGLTGRLGEFTARYAGRAPVRGHRIIVETADGIAATGFMTPSGETLDPEIHLSNRAHLRAAMTAALRAFAGSLPMPG